MACNIKLSWFFVSFSSFLRSSAWVLQKYFSVQQKGKTIKVSHDCDLSSLAFEDRLLGISKTPWTEQILHFGRAWSNFESQPAKSRICHVFPLKTLHKYCFLTLKSVVLWTSWICLALFLIKQDTVMLHIKLIKL